jgi:hypothetical protein
MQQGNIEDCRSRIFLSSVVVGAESKHFSLPASCGCTRTGHFSLRREDTSTSKISKTTSMQVIEVKDIVSVLWLIMCLILATVLHKRLP